MTKVIVDAAMQASLNNLDQLMEVRDESGRLLGYFHPVVEAAGPTAQGVKSPFSWEELERRRQQRTGRPLAEILERLNRS
jgi:hypothetical protein